jgi:PAS domain S-box-containing protein
MNTQITSHVRLSEKEDDTGWFRVLTPGLVAGFIAIIVVLIAMRVVNTLNLQRVYSTSEAVAHTFEVKVDLQKVLTVAVDAETGERGFIITGDVTNLEPYDRARNAISSDIAQLRRLTADNREQQADLDRLSALAAVKLEELANAIEQRRVSGLAAAQAVVATNLGKHTIDEMRLIVDRMGAREHGLLAARTAQAAQSYRAALLSGFLTTGLALVVVIALLMGTRRSGRERIRAAKTAERFRVTIASIGDAVIATDDEGRVTHMNAVAETLTGWTQGDAAGRPLKEVFVIINEESRQPVENPIERVLRENAIVGLANHTVLISKEGLEIPVDDSAASIKSADGARIIGVVLVFRDVTERRRTEQKHTLALNRLAEQARLLDLTHDAIFVRDLNDRIVYWNRGAEEYYGWTQAEAAGKVTHDLLRTEFPEPLEEILATVRREGQWSGDLIHTHRGGARIHVASRWTLDRDTEGRPTGILEINNDVTQRKRAEVALRESEERFRDLVEDAPFGVYIVDSEFRIAHMNRGSQTGAFRNVRPAIGRGFADAMRILWPEPVAQEIIKIFRHTLDTGESYRSPRFTEPRHDIEIVESYEWELHRITLADGKFGVVCYYFDSTPLRQAEEALRKMEVQRVELAAGERALASEKALRETEAELARVVRALTVGDLAASIAHEVNQPLAGVVTNAEAGLRWLDGETPNLEEARESLTLIVRDGNRASAVIRRIREFLRKERQLMPLNANDVIEDVVELVRSELTKRQITLRTELSSQLPPVLGDRIPLQQVVLNLILNGADAMTSTSGSDERSECKPDRAQPSRKELVIASQKAADGGVLVSVRDCGDGIAPQDMKRMFDPFFTTKPAGMGLGLSLSRSIVESHGGRIWAQSNDGSGLTVQFSLPAESSRQESAPGSNS